MRIAVSADEDSGLDSAVSHHFGRCPYYVLADLEEAAERVESDMSGDLADIFRAHAAIVRDPTLSGEILDELEDELVNAEHVVKEVFHKWVRRFRAMEDEVLRERGDVACVERVVSRF